MRDYNGNRLYLSLGDQTFREFARCHMANTPVGGYPEGPNPHLSVGTDSGDLHNLTYLFSAAVSWKG